MQAKIVKSKAAATSKCSCRIARKPPINDLKASCINQLANDAAIFL